MRMTNAQMYKRVLAEDSTYNGRFFTGVLTTGIYCLPSCKARKPKPDNVRFFPSCETAREAGLRACKKCHPDDFERGADPVLETIEQLVAEVRSDPSRFVDGQAIVRRSGFGSTRLFELLRQHFHSTPADLLLRARIDKSRHSLLAGKDSLATIAAEVGFESLSSFHDNFRRLNGLTPNVYRSLPTQNSFKITLPDGFPLPYLFKALSRDSQSVTERMEGDVVTMIVRLGTGPVGLALALSPDEIAVKCSGGPTVEAHSLVCGLIGLDQDAAGFARLANKLGLARLVKGRHEMRISQTPSVFDGLLWSIIGQQINFSFACVLKRRLIERCGTPWAEGLYAPPTPSAIASLAQSDLLPLQFSRQKADYLLSAARLVAEGKLDLESLRTKSATRVERTLLEVRGLGPWSVNYLMMRSLGFSDCVPLGDTGVTSGLQSLLKLEERPDVDATRRLMAMFSPYRSLATAHLWQL